jgi:hypothetical protein
MQRRPSSGDLAMQGNAAASGGTGAADIPPPTTTDDDFNPLLTPTTPGSMSPVLSVTSSKYPRTSLAGSHRHRSSAASSRRNSISSTHSHASSHHSHHSLHHSRPQSRHVAQQLRRASIMESRKARLAQRAEHAEQVRIRAALAKASPRNQNHTEERALAAQQARDKHLAQVASSCAEEVRRAKRVAEDMKEKRETNERRAREEMQERQAEAERRRVEFLDRRHSRKPRSSSVIAADMKKKPASSQNGQTADQAARRIQRVWRAGLRRRIARNYLALGLSIEAVKAKSVDEITTALTSTSYIKCAAEALRLCGWTDVDVSAQSPSARMFLCIFMILSHPAIVLKDDGEQEQDLMCKAKDLLISFDELLIPFSRDLGFIPLPSRTKAFREAFTAYETVFEAWKAQDSSVLISSMVAQYIELDEIWQKVKDSTEEIVAEEYRSGIREAQVILMVRIKRLAGPEQARTLIRDAIRDARRNRPKKPHGDVRPRAARTDAEAVPQFNDLETPEKQAILRAEALTALNQPPSDELYKRLPVPPLNHVFLTQMPTNRTLVHELALNKDYHLVQEQTSVKATIRAAVLQSMRRDLGTEAGNGWIVAIAVFLNHHLRGLVKQGSAMAKLIDDVLDPELIKSEIQKGTFSHAKLFEFVYSILPKICAPARDEAVKALSEDNSGDEFDRFERLMKVIDLMLLDFANFVLQLNKPELIKAAASYEADKFEKDWHSKHGLKRAKRWYAASKERALQEAARRDPEGVNHPAIAPTFSKIYNEALVDSATSLPMTIPVLEAMTPEMLHMDTQRLLQFQIKVLHLGLASAILLTAKNLLRQDVRGHWKETAQVVLKLLSDYAPSYDQPELHQSILAAITAKHVMSPEIEERIETFIRKVLIQAATSQINDPVARLLRQRLITHLQTRLSAKTARERVNAESTASESLAKSGLPEYVAEVAVIVTELKGIRDVDQGSHAKWWTLVEEAVANGDNGVL